MIYLTYESAAHWAAYLNSRHGHVKVSIRRVENGWTIY
jgi:hypothetical protein